MQMTKREKWIVIVTAVVVGLYVLDWWVLTPSLAWRADLHTARDKAEGEMFESQRLVRELPGYHKRWKSMREAGLEMTRQKAEARVYNKLREWAQTSGMNLQTVNSVRIDEQTPVPEIIFRATATGSMRSMTGFFERLEGASFPLRVKKMRISSRRDGADDLSLDLTFSTVYQPRIEIEESKSASQAPGRDTDGASS